MQDHLVEPVCLVKTRGKSIEKILTKYPLTLENLASLTCITDLSKWEELARGVSRAFNFKPIVVTNN